VYRIFHSDKKHTAEIHICLLSDDDGLSEPTEECQEELVSETGSVGPLGAFLMPRDK